MVDSEYIPILGTIATVSRIRRQIDIQQSVIHRRRSGAGGNSLGLTLASAAATLGELRGFLVYFLIVVFEVTGCLLRESVAGDGSCGNIKLATAPPSGLLYSYSHFR